ncbi:unnamed protein product [Linum trigynum]|uniref:Mitochondrial protein n=1 Tax=Linum trigynum TaxID=586398 RepID=A0AAV2ES23_9ROSI
MSAAHDTPLSNVELYRRLVGKLIYLTTTCPDISFSTQQSSKFMANPGEEHYKALLRVLRYLKHAPSTSLFFQTSNTLHLKGYSDSDWASCPDTRRSITGYCIYLGKERSNTLSSDPPVKLSTKL